MDALYTVSVLSALLGRLQFNARVCRAVGKGNTTCSAMVMNLIFFKNRASIIESKVQVQDTLEYIKINL